MRFIYLLSLLVLLFQWNKYEQREINIKCGSGQYMYPFILAISTILYFNPMVSNIYLLELTILLMIIMEDEMNFEVSVDLLILIALLKICAILIYKIDVNGNVLIISFLIFVGLFVFSGGNYGLGDVVLSIILSTTIADISEFIFYFLLMFTIPAAILLIAYALNKIERDSKVPFIKYIILSYVLITGGIIRYVF